MVGVSRRAVLRASAWSAPVVALAVASPLAAASGGGPALLSARFAGPTRFTEGDGGSAFAVWVTNLGTETIPAGSLLASMREGPGFTFSGFSGLAGTWDYGPNRPDGLTFLYGMDVPPGTAGNEDDETLPLLLYLANDQPGTQPAPFATVVISAPGYGSTAVLLPVTY